MTVEERLERLERTIVALAEATRRLDAFGDIDTAVGEIREELADRDRVAGEPPCNCAWCASDRRKKR